MVICAIVPFADAAPRGDSVSVETALLLIITGALLFIARHLAAISQRLSRLEEPRRTTPTLPPPALAGSRVEAMPADPEVRAAIVAAIHCSLGDTHRVIAVRPLAPEQHAWSVEGRRQIFQSHHVR